MVHRQALLVLLLVAANAVAQEYRIDSITGQDYDSEVGLRAAKARLDDLRAFVVDSKGNVYISESGAHRIWKIGGDGLLTAFAGNGKDGARTSALAVDAQFEHPNALALQRDGTLFVYDSKSHALQKIEPTGNLKSAGSGAWHAFISGETSRKPPFTDEKGEASSRRFYAVPALAADDAGNLYVADPIRNMVWRITPDERIVPFAGTGQEGFSGDQGLATKARLAMPRALAIDREGRVYITDLGNNRIRRVDKSGKITTFVNFTPPNRRPKKEDEDEKFFGATDLAFDSQGNLYGQTDPCEISRITPDGKVSKFLTAGQYGIECPGAVRFGPGDEPYIGDYEVNQIRVIRNGASVVIAGRGADIGDGGPWTQAIVNSPNAIAIDVQGNLYLAEHGVRKIDKSGTITTVASPKLTAKDAKGEIVQQWDPLIAVAPAPDGTIYFTESRSGHIWKLSPERSVSVIPLPAFSAPYIHGLVVDPSGVIYASDGENNRLMRITPDGKMTLVVENVSAGYAGDGGPAAKALLNGPTGLALDAEGNLYIADTGNHTIRKISPDGIIRSLTDAEIGNFSGDGGPARDAHLKAPKGVSVDQQGNVYIADTGNHRIRKIGMDGIIRTIAGQNSKGFDGDGGPALQGHLSSPASIAIDADGKLYVCDLDDDQIRKLTPLDSTR